MKYTILVTNECNLSCTYCYIGKGRSRMSTATARRVVDFAFENTPAGEEIDIGFFGGEPFLEPDLLKEIVGMIKTHPAYEAGRVVLSVTSNGTIFSEEIAGFLAEHEITLCISCDGPPERQDLFRRFKDSRGSSKIVEKNIASALKTFPSLSVNVVYGPETLQGLPDTLDYLTAMGLRRVYLSPDYSANWTEKDSEKLPEVFGGLAGRYVSFHLRGDPRYISLIDSKVAVLVNGGYKPEDRCRMGHGEYAFTPGGNVYPCERLVGNDDGKKFCLGNVMTGTLSASRCGIKEAGSSALNEECLTCGISAYCMNWCGCSNYFSSGRLDRVGPFLCASERAMIEASASAFQTLGEKLGPAFIRQFVNVQTGDDCGKQGEPVGIEG